MTDQQGEISDLKAALDATYRERAHLVALLAALYPSHIGHTDPTAPDWAVLITEAPGGQMSWHMSPRDMDLFAHVQPTNRICRGWDGHTTDEKYERIRDLTEAAPSLLGQDTLIEHQGRQIKQQAAELVAARAAIARVREAAHLHRQGLLSIAELYAVIGPALDEQPEQPAATFMPRCVCGDPIQLIGDPGRWTHSLRPGKDPHCQCLVARPDLPESR